MRDWIDQLSLRARVVIVILVAILVIEIAETRQDFMEPAKLSSKKARHGGKGFAGWPFFT